MDSTFCSGRSVERCGGGLKNGCDVSGLSIIQESKDETSRGKQIARRRLEEMDKINKIEGGCWKEI